MVAFVTRPLPVLVECEPLSARLTERACVARHVEARKPPAQWTKHAAQPVDGGPCRYCSTGAARAGLEPLTPKGRPASHRPRGAAPVRSGDLHAPWRVVRVFPPEGGRRHTAVRVECIRCAHRMTARATDVRRCRQPCANCRERAGGNRGGGWSRRIPDETVIRIRAMHDRGIGPSAIAAELGIAVGTASMIGRRKRRAEVPDHAEAAE